MSVGVWVFLFFFGGGGDLSVPTSFGSQRQGPFRASIKDMLGCSWWQGDAGLLLHGFGLLGLSLFGESDLLGVLLFEVLWVRGSRLIAF